jgi:hypothetical protein
MNAVLYGDYFIDFIAVRDFYSVFQAFCDIILCYVMKFMHDFLPRNRAIVICVTVL